jgi:hypothetical protein
MNQQEKPKVVVGGWGTINCNNCGKKQVGGVITYDHGEICNICLKEKYVEVKTHD